ncbi:aldo/keto reductase [Nonomuraea soli]
MPSVAPMRQVLLGHSGLKVSELCLGAMTFGRESDERTSHAMLDAFTEAGGDFIDTADVYSSGVSEEILGRWLKSRPREDVIVATKVRWGPGGNREGLTRAHILRSVEGSLRRLGTDYIDLYQLHGWDDVTPLEQTLGTLDLLVRQGKVRYLGVSNWSGWQLQKGVDLQRHRGWEPFVSLQPLYNLLDRETELELMPVCANEGLGVIPWSPLRGGWLSGKYHRGMDAPPAGTRVEEAGRNNWSEDWDTYATERTWRVLEEAAAVAQEAGRTVAQVALRWLLQQPGVTAPIVGARTLEHFGDNLGATGWELSQEQVARLTAVSDRPLPYPYDVLARSSRR